MKAMADMAVGSTTVTTEESTTDILETTTFVEETPSSGKIECVNGTELCGPCNCPNTNTKGFPGFCLCPEGQEVVKASKTNHFCCKTSIVDGHTWPKPCGGATIDKHNYERLGYSCGDNVVKNCGQCVKGGFLSYTDPETQKMGCCCNRSPDRVV